MIDWTDAAIEAAIRGWFDTDDAFRPRMRAALDAAVKAQPGIITAEEFSNSQRRAYRLGRADALEEAATLIEAEMADEFDVTRRVLAAAIRALKEKRND